MACACIATTAATTSASRDSRVAAAASYGYVPVHCAAGGLLARRISQLGTANKTISAFTPMGYPQSLRIGMFRSVEGWTGGMDGICCSLKAWPKAGAMEHCVFSGCVEFAAPLGREVAA